MTTTEITNVSQMLDLSDWYGDFAGDFDTEAVRAEYVAALNAAAGAGVYVTASGIVYAELEDADRACDIDWRELADSIDLDAIAQRHDKSAR